MAAAENEQADRYVYLVQHGEAEAKTTNPERPLTADGKASVEKMAAWAAKMALKIDQIRHSGKLRAAQTASIFAEMLHPPEGSAEYPGLGPNDDVQPVADALADWPYSVMLVGHLPFLGRLVGLMVAGDPDRQVVRFRNGGVVGLVRVAQQWKIWCVVPPEVLED